MSRQRTSTRRTVAPSQRARTTLSEAGPYIITASPGRGSCAPARSAGVRLESAGTSRIRALVSGAAAPWAPAWRAKQAPRAIANASPAPLAPARTPVRRFASAPGEAVTRELGLSALWELLDQFLERALGVRRAPEPVLAQPAFVECGRGAVALRPAAPDARVLGQRAVEPGLGEEALAHAVLRVVREVRVGVPLEEVAVGRERERVAALREVLGGLVVELRGPRAAGRGRRRRGRGPAARGRVARAGGLPLGLDAEARHDVVQLALEPAERLLHLAGGAGRGRARGEQLLALLGQLAPGVLERLQVHRVARAHLLHLRLQAVERGLEQRHLRRVAAGRQGRGGEQHARHGPPDQALPCRAEPRAGDHRAVNSTRRFRLHDDSSWPSTAGRSLP